MAKDARFTAVEYLALVGAVNQLQSAAEDNPEVYADDLRAADRALSKVHATLTPAQLREVARRLAPPGVRPSEPDPFSPTNHRDPRPDRDDDYTPAALDRDQDDDQ